MAFEATEDRLRVNQFESANGDRIFQIPVQEFPILWGYVYVVLARGDDGKEYRVLVDAGSGFGDSNRHLEAGLQAVAGFIGGPFSLEDLTHVLITHGHIDHFGGLSYVRPRTKALIGVHELDLRNLTRYEERLTVVAGRLEAYLREAGVEATRRGELMDMYRMNKSLYRSVNVDFTYEAAGMRLGPFRLLHVPGHCAGQVVIRLHDVLFSGDHVLEHTSPHQSPEELTLSTGLEHYLHSLGALDDWAGDVRLTLGGHNRPILDLKARIVEIRRVHRDRLDQLLAILETPHTISEASDALFGDVHGYNSLLALEETGAHIEYLYQRGGLCIANLDDLERLGGASPVVYVRNTRYLDPCLDNGKT